MSNYNDDKKIQVLRLIDVFELQKITGKLVIHFKEGEVKGGSQETSF
jgi:hypothetical protein